jgi:hypothetical protein
MKKMLVLIMPSVIGLILCGLVYGANLWDAIKILKDHPQQAYEIARNYPVPEKDSDYIRFLKIFIMLYNANISDKDFNQYIEGSIGKGILTTAIPLANIKTEGNTLSVIIDTCDRDIKINVITELKDTSFLNKDRGDYFVFSGNIGSVCKEKNKFIIVLKDGGYQIAGGPDTVTKDESEKLFNLVDAEKWEQARDIAKEYTGRYKVGSDPMEYRVRFCYLESLVGMVEEGKMTYKELSNEMDKLKGRVIVFRVQCNDCVSVSENEPKEALVKLANNKGSFTHVFISIKNFIDVKKTRGYTEVNVNGALKSFETNPNKSSGSWILRLYLDPGIIFFNK